jgi:DNA-binding MarR family transcriptional regulator
MFEYLVLAMLSEAPGQTLQLKRLATIVNGSLSRLSHVVTRLEKRDWVRRAPLPENGRITMATLTPAGYDKVVASAPSHVRTVRELVFDRLGPDQVRQLASISDQLLVPLGTDCLPERPERAAVRRG